MLLLGLVVECFCGAAGGGAAGENRTATAKRTDALGSPALGPALGQARVGGNPRRDTSCACDAWFAAVAAAATTTTTTTATIRLLRLLLLLLPRVVLDYCDDDDKDCHCNRYEYRRHLWRAEAGEEETAVLE